MVYELYLQLGIWRLKLHQTQARTILFMGIWSGKEPKQTGKRATGANKVK